MAANYRQGLKSCIIPEQQSITHPADLMMQKYLPDEEIDSLCDEFERNSVGQNAPGMESYLERVNAPRRPILLYWLLRISMQHRADQSGPSVGIEEFRRQFPGYESVFNDLARTIPKTGSALPRIPGYAVERLVKRGGQGAVYRALQNQTGQHVAIKLVPEKELRTIPPGQRLRVVARLKKEIRIAASMNHPNVVRIFDAGECPDGFYFIMQLVEGGSLAERARDLSQIAAVKIVRSIASALQEAHEAGVLHLDIKPQNILFDDVAGQPLLADFGLARLSRESGDSLAIAGTPGFMAPEQAMGREPDRRSDVFGLGATLYRLLTGQDAYENVSLPFSETERERWIPVSPRVLNRNINPELERICLKCLQFEPEDRFQDCREVARAIDRFAATEDGRRIAATATRTIITSPLFLLINLLVFVQLQMGWANDPVREMLVWITMFSMYGVVFFVFGSLSNLDRHSPEHLAMESLWAVWLAKMFAAITVAGSLRMLASGNSVAGPGAGAVHVKEAILMCYPMFCALTGFVMATLAARYWRQLYAGAVLCWLHSFVLMATVVLKLSIAPLLYGAAATMLAIVWGVQLKRMAREQARFAQLAELAKTVDMTGKQA